MSEAAALPKRMSLAHGGRALLVAAVAEVTGTTAAPDHAVAIALISVIGGFVVMLVQLTVSDYLRNRRIHQQHPDHGEEQAELNDLLISELHRLRVENERLKRKNKP